MTFLPYIHLLTPVSTSAKTLPACISASLPCKTTLTSQPISGNAPFFRCLTSQPAGNNSLPYQLAMTSCTQPQDNGLSHGHRTTLPARCPTSHPTTSLSTPSTHTYIRRTLHILLSHTLVACTPHCALVGYECYRYYCVLYTYSF